MIDPSQAPRKRPSILTIGSCIVAVGAALVFADQYGNDGAIANQLVSRVSGDKANDQSGPTTDEEGTSDPEPTELPTSDPSATAEPGAEAPVVVIDPGFSGKTYDKKSKVEVNGKTYTIRDHDWKNAPAVYESFDIGKCVGDALMADGYTITLTKTKAEDTVGLVERVKIADAAKADLAISIFEDHNLDDTFQAVYSQKGIKKDGAYGDMYRIDESGERIVFSNTKVANASHKAAQAIKAARSEAQGQEVGLNDAPLDTQAGPGSGNIWTVQVLSETAWVYNQMGAKTGNSSTKPMTIQAETEYAEGLVNGVEAALDYDDGQPNTGVNGLKDCLTKQGASWR